MPEREPPAWWPHRAASDMVAVRHVRWHVQRWACQQAQAPVALLLHGTGASSHSWRQLAPLVSQNFRVVAPDLPGHGFTTTPARHPLSLPAVASDIADLMASLAIAPALVIGHSAGAAIAVRLASDRCIRPELLVSINGALMPPQGTAGRWFLPLARLLASNPLVPPAFATWARLPTAARRMLSGTGSWIDSEGERCYGHLMQDPLHAAGALRLMASWDLASMQGAVAALDVPLLLLASGNDRMVPPEQARLVARHSHHAQVAVLPGVGHLAHEESAAAVAAAIDSAWRKAHSPAPPSAQCAGTVPVPTPRVAECTPPPVRPPLEA